MKKTDSIHPVSLLAPYSDAIKLILTGATDETLTAEQKTIYLDMLVQGMKDDKGNQLKERHLPGVRKEEYCIDEENGKSDSVYFIPDLFRFMFTVFEERGIFAPPVDLDYLNSLKDEAGNSPRQKQWELICSKIEIEREFVELDRTHHAGDPLKLEAQKRMRAGSVIKLHDISEKLNKWTYSAKKQTSTEQDWIEEAKKIGRMYIKQYPHLNMEKISDKVHKQMKESGITGRGGRVPKPSTIKRHALNNIKR